MRSKLGAIRDQIEEKMFLRDFFVMADKANSGTVPIQAMADALEEVLNVQELSLSLQIYNPKQITMDICNFLDWNGSGIVSFPELVLGLHDGQGRSKCLLEPICTAILAHKGTLSIVLAGLADRDTIVSKADLKTVLLAAGIALNELRSDEVFTADQVLG